MSELTDAPETGRFCVLFVCTGNICRSALAECYARRRLSAADGFLVTSAGTRAVPGAPMDQLSAEALRQLGGTSDGFGSRVLTPELVAGADLVLAAAREHRAAAVQCHPLAAGRAFTLLEFAALADAAGSSSVGWRDSPVRRARALVREAARHRGHLALRSAADDDIADPRGGPLASHVAVGGQVAGALAALITVAGAAPGLPPAPA